MNVHADKERGGSLCHAQGAHFLWHATFVALSLSRNYELNSHPWHLPCLRKQGRQPLGQGQQLRHIVLIFNGRHPATRSDF